MELQKIGDDMGFEKIDHIMVYEMEYVKVEKADADMESEKEMVDDGMEHVKEEVVDDVESDKEEKVEVGMAFDKNVDEADQDTEYEKTYVDFPPWPYADMESEKEMVDDGMEHVKEEVVDDVESDKEEKVEIGMAFDKKVDEADQAIEHEKTYVDFPPWPFPKQSKDMKLKDIVKDIVLPFLPAKALFRFRSVSKEWDRWIRNPFLAHQQSYYFKDLSGFFCQDAAGRHGFVTLDDTAHGVPHQPLDFLPELVDMLSSCNGLLLCHCCYAPDTYYVCNPTTQEWVSLPPPEQFHGFEPSAVLAFEPSVLNMGAHYHVLCVVPMPHHVCFEIYSSDTNSWTVSETILVEMEDLSIKDNGFYMKGIAYMETYTGKVIAFHLSSELYEVISLPPETQQGALTQVQGELCYIGVSHLSKNEYSVSIYTGMDLGLKSRVTVEFGAELNSLPQYQVLPCLDGENMMILVGSYIYCYSTMDQNIKTITWVGTSASASSKYLAYVNSLVRVANSSDSLF